MARPKGSLNKSTSAVKKLAGKYTKPALKTLASIMNDTTEPAPARVAAARELLDRGHGKAPQSVTGPEGGPIQLVKTVVHEHLTSD